MKKIWLLILFSVISWIGLLLAANQWYFGYWVSSTESKATLNSSSVTISTRVSKIAEWWVCKTLTSTDTRLLFCTNKNS